MLTPEYTTQFKKDYKRVSRRNYDMSLIEAVMGDLVYEILLPEKHKDHLLLGNYAGFRECHIKPDWLLIYQIGDGIIVFERTGTHSDLFG